jgi:hypothetical protein
VQKVVTQCPRRNRGIDPPQPTERAVMANDTRGKEVGMRLESTTVPGSPRCREGVKTST